MADRRDILRLKALAAGRLAPEDVTRLYRRAFEAFGTRALWSRRPDGAPTIAQALVVAEALRREGDGRSRALAIEQACRAAL